MTALVTDFSCQTTYSSSKTYIAWIILLDIHKLPSTVAITSIVTFCPDVKGKSLKMFPRFSKKWGIWGSY